MLITLPPKVVIAKEIPTEKSYLYWDLILQSLMCQPLSHSEIACKSEAFKVKRAF